MKCLKIWVIKLSVDYNGNGNTSYSLILFIFLLILTSVIVTFTSHCRSNKGRRGAVGRHRGSSTGPPVQGPSLPASSLQSSLSGHWTPTWFPSIALGPPGSRKKINNGAFIKKKKSVKCSAVCESLHGGTEADYIRQKALFRSGSRWPHIGHHVLFEGLRA